MSSKRSRRAGLERRKPRWTPIEVHILRADYPAIGADGCVPLLSGRGVGGITRKAQRLGIPRPQPEQHQ